MLCRSRIACACPTAVQLRRRCLCPAFHATSSLALHSSALLGMKHGGGEEAPLPGLTQPFTPFRRLARFSQYEARRQGKYSKTLAGGALLGSNGMDEGLDRHAAPPRR